MKNLKETKGITLIALVITIIVMLILVAVTITVAVNGGLFDYARKAAVDTNTAIEDEQDWANISTGQDYEQLIAKYTTNKWVYTDVDNSKTINVGDILTVGTESFYVISNDNSTTITLLAAKNVDITTNKQSLSAEPVAFDSEAPYSNDYDSSTIKPLVNKYVKSLKVAIVGNEGRLMTKEEVVALGGNLPEEDTSGCTGSKAFVNATNFWLGSSFDEDVCVVDGNEQTINGAAPSYGDNFGLRPVIVISKSNI